MDCSPPGSSVHGIFQARVLEWVAISFSRVGSFSVGCYSKSEECLKVVKVLSDPLPQHKDKGLELTIERSYQTHSHKIHFKMIGLV